MTPALSPRSVTLCGLCVLAATGCGDLLHLDDYRVQQVVPSQGGAASASTGDSGSGAGGVGGGGGGGGAGGGCITETLEPIADARICTLQTNACGGMYGAGSTLQMTGVLPDDTCVVLLMFQPSAQAFAATNAGTAALELELHRVTTHAECAPNPFCPAVPGYILVRPLRVDWKELVVDWCTRDTSMIWDAPGASLVGVDTFDPVANPTVNDTQPSITIELANIVHFQPALANGFIALRVETQGGAAFVAASKDYGIISGPTLRVHMCQ